jgi:hypothetical protein
MTSKVLIIVFLHGLLDTGISVNTKAAPQNDPILEGTITGPSSVAIDAPSIGNIGTPVEPEPHAANANPILLGVPIVPDPVEGIHIIGTPAEPDPVGISPEIKGIGKPLSLKIKLGSSHAIVALSGNTIPLKSILSKCSVCIQSEKLPVALSTAL